MDAEEQIKSFQEFLQAHYHAELMDSIRKGKNFFVIDFIKLSQYNIDLTNDLLENPEEVIKAGEIAVEQFDTPTEVINFRIRIKNLPDNQSIMIRNIRSKQIGKFLHIEGTVRQKSDVRPQVTTAKFECPACGNVLNVIQQEEKFKEPTRCSCGRKGKFRLLNKELIDAQGIVLEEATDNLDGGEQPKRMNVFLKEDLVSPMSDKKTNPGTKISINGFVREVPITLKSGSQSTRFELLIEANFVQPVEEDFSEVKISKKDEDKILSMGRDPKIYDKLIESSAPSIWGYEKIKEAILYQLVGGVKKHRSDGISTRGDIHILLIGDPGAGKCLAGDSKIVLGDGSIVKIKDFVNQEKNNIIDNGCYSLKNNFILPSFSKSCKIKTNNILKLWKRKAPNKLLRITTTTGNIITVTKNHPFFTTKHSLVYAIDAKNLKANNYIATPNNICTNSSIQSTNFTIEKSRSPKKLPIIFPTILDNNFARLIGYLIGDGYVRFRKTTGIVSLTNIDPDTLSDFDNLMFSIFNLKCNKRKIQNSNISEYYITSIECVRFLEKLDSCITKDSLNTKIPTIIQKSPNHILKEFLIGLFESEAHVSNREIQISSKSYDLITDLKLCLLRFGIISQISTKIKCATNTINKTKRTYYELRLTGINVKKYQEDIGFISTKKSTKLNKILSIKKNRNTNINIIPNLCHVLKIIRKKYNLTQKDMGISRSAYQHYEKGDRNPSYDTLKKIASTLMNINNRDPQIKLLYEIANSDIFWDKIKSIETINSNNDFVYDLEIDSTHNYISNGIMVHNSQLLKRATKISPKARFVSGKGASGAGLTAAVVKDEFLGGWSLEAGALVLANKGLCCTTKDAKFILKNGKHMTFEELFKNKSDILYPKFEILALNNKTLKIESFKIKRAFKIKNDKQIYSFKTRTGRELKLTEDNEVLTVKNSKPVWVTINKIKKNEYIAVPKYYPSNTKSKHSKDFAYIAGLIASDGSIKLNNKNAMTTFYNTNEHLIKKYENILDILKIKHKKTIQKKGRKSIIRGKEVISKKDLFVVYNTRKEFAKKMIDFGVPSGNKSTINPLNNKIFTYNKNTICNFLKGVFDGDGSIRENPTEITITSGMKDNVILFQELLLKIGIISSVKKSTNSWHCDVRGYKNSKLFFNLIGTNHPDKFNKFISITPKELKDRIDIIPNHQELFKNIIKKYKQKLGKDMYKYFWNYSKEKVSPSINKLKALNKFLNDKDIDFITNTDILWDKITEIKKIKEDYVYDFTMDGTNNFVANNIIMHNCIDELDKMTTEDRSAMHEALEGQTITISKANIQATLRAETTVLAAANPKYGRFDPYEILAKQINLPPALISRFDLIFPIKDIPEESKDRKMAAFILSSHKNSDKGEPEIDTEMLRKYIAYARQNIKPKLTDEAIEEIKEYYVQMRNSAGTTDNGVKSVPITTRQLEALIRLSEAASKIRMGDTVTKEDAKRAISLLNFCLVEVGMDPETGKIDIDRITSGISSSARNKIGMIKDIIGELENKFGKTIPVEEIATEAKERGLESDEVDDIIGKLKRAGDIFEPRRGLIQRL